MLKAEGLKTELVGCCFPRSASDTACNKQREEWRAPLSRQDNRWAKEMSNTLCLALPQEATCLGGL